MSEGKIRPLIARAQRDAVDEDDAKRAALAKDLYAALEAEREAIGRAIGTAIANAVVPLKARVERLEAETGQLQAEVDGLRKLVLG